MPLAQRNNRIFFIDYTRAFIILLIAVGHAALPYMLFVNYRWIVVDPAARNVLYDYLVLSTEVFVMAVLFFITGYLSLPSLRRHGPARFAVTRLARLGIPFAFGLAVLCPVMTYVRDLAKGRDMEGYFSYWLLTYFRGKMYAGYLWFLAFLLITTLLFCLAYALIPRLKAYLQAPAKPGDQAWAPGPWAFVLLGLGIGAGMFAINLFIPDILWVRIGQKGILTFQPTRLPLYFGYFICGIAASRSGWRFMSEPGSSRGIMIWGAGSLVSLAAYIAFLQTLSQVMESSVLLRLGHCMLRSSTALCMAMLALSGFKKWCNSPSRWKDVLAANAYGIYVAHVPIMVVLQYGLLNAELTAPVKHAIVAALGLSLSFLASHYGIRRLPVIGKYF